MSPAQGHPRVRSGRHVRQGPSSKPVPASRSFPVVRRWEGAVSRGPRKRPAPISGPALRKGAGVGPLGRPGLWTVVGTPGSPGPGRQAVQRAPRAPHRRAHPGADRCAEAGRVRASCQFSSSTPASGSLRTPLPARRVPRPAPLPVVAGPYIRCPPALGSAAAAMLSRSRCVSRAFSRSLSAFQKVQSGRAGARRMRNPPAGRGAAWGAGARRSGQAGHQGHRDAEAAGWAVRGRRCFRGRLAEPSSSPPPGGSRRPVLAGPHPPRLG